MKLSKLIEGVAVDRVRGDADVEITGLAYDNRRAEPGTLFFCVRGMTADGHEFAPDAVERGATALVVERELELDLPQVVVADARASMAPVAARFSKRFPEGLRNDLTGKEVMLEGTISLYRGTPQIELEIPEQITLVP
jgi:UDP-N-acetylmuramyl tripeptide synthase